MIGGYVVGIVSGCTMSFLYTAMNLTSTFGANAGMIVAGAFATSVAMFLMVVTRTEHPPWRRTGPVRLRQVTRTRR